MSDETPPKKTRLFQGIRIDIDRPKGFVQKGKDDDGTPWERVYKNDYGFLPKTKGGDGSGLDVFLGDHADAPLAYWFTQKKKDGSLDELKLFFGCRTKEEARGIYKAHVPEQFIGKCTAVPVSFIKSLMGVEPFEKMAKLAGFLGELHNSSLYEGLTDTLRRYTVQPG